MTSRQVITSFGMFATFATFATGLPAAMAAAETGGRPAQAESADPLEAGYTAMLASLRADVAEALPTVDARKQADLETARTAVAAARKAADEARQAIGKLQSAKGLVEHAKNKWIGDAEKGITRAEAALKNAASAAERETAEEELAKWRANKEEGIKALAERQAALAQLQLDEPALTAAHQAAQAALARQLAHETEAVRSLLAELEPLLASDTLDAKLVKGAVLAAATPQGLADFARKGPGQQALVDRLLSDGQLMKEMLIAGGANRNHYGRAMEIYTDILEASPRAAAGLYQGLALATALEHAEPLPQANTAEAIGAPAVVDPVKRYLHYEKASLDGELDPAFKGFSVWEYRMIVGCDAPDEILAWGREMLRTYRPDHISTQDYGWRYSAAVRTDVRYGSQHVKDDLPSLHKYQNIPMNGGVCGRRAFFGRFLLRSFGIPVWGVTQRAHAAVGRWTPDGWVVNLGAGFQFSWWDKDAAPRSGSDFLLETQAREHGSAYLKVLRAQWVGMILGEQAYNDRRNIPGGFWSRAGHYQTKILAADAVELGPVGEELAEANEPEAPATTPQAPVKPSEQRIVIDPNGTITIPAVAYAGSTGNTTVMASVSGGMQMHATGGFTARYEVTSPQAGRYVLTARVATLHQGQTFLLTANDSDQPIEAKVPLTIGLWQQSSPVEVSLVAGRNVLHYEVPPGTRGMTIKEFTLEPVK